MPCYRRYPNKFFCNSNSPLAGVPAKAIRTYLGLGKVNTHSNKGKANVEGDDPSPGMNLFQADIRGMIGALDFIYEDENEVNIITRSQSKKSSVNSQIVQGIIAYINMNCKSPLRWVDR